LGLGIGDPIVSPTFTLINEYPEGRIPLYHLDLYRLSPEGVLGLDLDQYLDPIEREPGVLAIEWPDRLGYLPPDRFRVTLAYGWESAPDSRRVTIEAFGAARIDPRWVLAVAAD
jgi:tRNA threonylcarbamoyladenosine biosynthesis protein TsaE